MKIIILDEFAVKLNEQIAFVAEDKPAAARKFKNEIIKLIKQLGDMPFKNRASIYFEDENIREAIFKGYKIIYRINTEKNRIEVFGFMGYQEKP